MWRDGSTSGGQVDEYQLAASGLWGIFPSVVIRRVVCELGTLANVVMVGHECEWVGQRWLY